MSMLKYILFAIALTLCVPQVAGTAPLDERSRLGGPGYVQMAQRGQNQRARPARPFRQIQERPRQKDRSFQRQQRRERNFQQRPLRRDNQRIDRQRAQQRTDQDRARDAVRRGEALPLDRIISRLQSYCPGRFLDATLTENRGRLYYRVRILSNSGRRVGIVVDAATGNVVRGQCG